MAIIPEVGCEFQGIKVPLTNILIGPIRPRIYPRQIYVTHCLTGALQGARQERKARAEGEGNVNAPTQGVGIGKNRRFNPMHLDMYQALRCHRQIEAERATLPSAGLRGHNVCRMHGAGGGAPRANQNALKHGEFAAEGLALRRQISALDRMTRETMGAIEWQCGNGYVRSRWKRDRDQDARSRLEQGATVEPKTPLGGGGWLSGRSLR
jgi:hypothetical protein